MYPTHLTSPNGANKFDTEITPAKVLGDLGPHASVIDIEDDTIHNSTYRTARWTGTYLQVTLMSIDVGKDIGLEVHQDTDQFLRIEQGRGLVRMGNAHDDLYLKDEVLDGDAILIPAGTWHNITNIGDVALKLYSIYAPPHHPHGTVELSKADK